MNIKLNTNRNFRTAGIMIAALATLGTAACGGASELIESQAEAVAPAEQQISEPAAEYDNTSELEDAVSALQGEVDRLQGELEDATQTETATQPQQRSTNTPTVTPQAQAPADEPAPQAEEPAVEDEPAPAPVEEEQMVEKITANAEVDGEDCDAIKDFNQYTMDINGGAEVIMSELTNPGDVCDFYNFTVKGLDNFNIKSGTLRFVLSCDDDRFIEANNQGRGGFDWKVGGPNGVKYHCGDSWEQNVSYQSYQKSVAVYVNPAQTERQADYKLTVIAIPN